MKNMEYLRIPDESYYTYSMFSTSVLSLLEFFGIEFSITAKS
jgi:hypothetical protein